ncbi:MAG: DUF4352 domain-containing protein [Pauljensenia sp.]
MTIPPHPTEPTEPTTPPGAPVPPGTPVPPGFRTPSETPLPQGAPSSSSVGRQRNTLALVALVVAVLGSVFALIHGAMIIGWILLPIAFILSIVALVQHGRPKGVAVAALVVSIVGTIVGVVAFMGAVGDAVDDAFNTPVSGVAQSDGASPSGEPTVSAPADGDADDGAGDAGGATASQGTRENPFPLGTAISGSDWTVTVNSFTADATDQVLAANQFNEAPADGSVYALANVTITYTGDSSGYAMETTTDYVTAGGNVIGSTDSIAVAPDAIGLDELYPGASVTGNVVLEIPTGDAGLLRVRPGILSDEAFVAVS